MGSIELWYALQSARMLPAAPQQRRRRESAATEVGDGGGGDNGGGNRGDGDGGDSSGRGDGAAKVRRERPSAAGCTAFMLLCALPTQQTVCMIVHVVRCAPSPPWLLRETATDSITKMGNFYRSKIAHFTDSKFAPPTLRGAVRVVSLRRIGCCRITPWHNPESHSGFRGDVKRKGLRFRDRTGDHASHRKSWSFGRFFRRHRLLAPCRLVAARTYRYGPATLEANFPNP